MALAQRIAPILTDICARLHVVVPYVSVRDDALRPAGIRRVRGQTILILSRTLAIGLGEAELRGLIAHEIAHLACGDLESSRRKGLWVPVITLAATLALIALVADFFAVIAPPAWAAMWVVVSLGIVTALAPSNRPREMRADAIAATICADPSVVASALEQTAALIREGRQAVYGAPPLSWLLMPVSWTMPSHPSMAERTARLRGMTTRPITTICGVMIARVGLGFARGALARKDQIALATFMLVLSPCSGCSAGREGERDRHLVSRAQRLRGGCAVNRHLPRCRLHRRGSGGEPDRTRRRHSAVQRCQRPASFCPA
jgi:hypothetical protein